MKHCFFLDATGVAKGLGRSCRALALCPNNRIQGSIGAEVAPNQQKRSFTDRKSNIIRAIQP
jgi:hypothetical protein